MGLIFLFEILIPISVLLCVLVQRETAISYKCIDVTHLSGLSPNNPALYSAVGIVISESLLTSASAMRGQYCTPSYAVHVLSWPRTVLFRMRLPSEATSPF